MKTITAEKFNKKPGPVFREVDREGAIKINHEHYPDRMFILSSRPRNPIEEAVKKAVKAVKSDHQEVR